MHVQCTQRMGTRGPYYSMDNRDRASMMVRLHVASFDNRVRGYHCPRCRGILLDRFDFRDTLYARRRAATQPPAPPHPLDRSHLARRVHCPRCGRPMETHPYLGPGNIVIDTCNVCNLIWLDGMELEQATNAPGLDRSPAHSAIIGSKRGW